MNKAIDRAIAYMAKTCERGIKFVTKDNVHPRLDYEVYSDSDWCVAHSTSGSHSRTLTTGKFISTPNARCPASPPRLSGNLLP